MLGAWALASTASTAVAATSAADGPHTTGTIAVKAVKESSGLAGSRRDPTLLWTHNDSGGKPVLYGFDVNGQPRGQLKIAGVHNSDWEDLAAFTLDGVDYLLIADTGDNGGGRTNAALHIVEEPNPALMVAGASVDASVAWTLPVRYLNGPRDCEAVAVDAAANQVLLITKREQPNTVYSLPLRLPRQGTVPAATPIARLTGIRPSSGLGSLLPMPAGLMGDRITACDLSPDGRLAVVLTYSDVWLYARPAGGTWADAFARQPQRLHPHGLFQAEAVAFTADGRHLYVTTEQASPPLLRYDLPPADAR